MNPELLAFWPSETDVAACVKTDAEAASEAVFMAVHQPVTFERRSIGAENTVTSCNERDFLEAFLDQTLSEGRVIVPLVGNSGTGKSHIVRWVAATLNHLPDAKRRVVIRIPKGTSLKGVLDLLLKKLDEPEYEPFRAKLITAQEQLDPEKAAGLLCEMLALTLADKVVAANSQLLKDPSDRNARETSDYGKASMLPTLLRNQKLRERHFVGDPGGVTAPIRRLVEQLTDSRDSNEEDDRKHIFDPEDLNFDSVQTVDLGAAEKMAIAQLSRPDRRAIACRVLNRALDEAKQSLLGIDPTVTDLFDAVRAKLLEQDKELVLLVEDFVVLSGIQRQILQVIIKEAIRDGKQVLCTMRTVLAYTSGYLDTATVLTRAGAEYLIPDVLPSEEEIFERIERLVGAYLNAARLGQAELEEAYDQASLDTRSQSRWMPLFEPGVDEDTQKTVDKFNISVDGYSLFPFNRLAIRELSREGSQRAGQLIYNPRFVIQNVLNKVLKHRQTFERNQFPSDAFDGSSRRLAARVVDEVRSLVNPDDFDRWIRFFSYWGGRPSSTDELTQVSSPVALAFGLDPKPLKLPSDVKDELKATVGTAKDNKSVPPSAQGSTTTPQTGRGAERSQAELQFEETLEKWRSGHPLGQSQAVQIRKLLAEAVDSFVPWDWDLFRPLDSVAKRYESVYLPNSGGNRGITEDGPSTMFALCTERDLLDAERGSFISLALMAVFRHHQVYRGSWEYPEADGDLPRYSALIQGFVEPALTFMRKRYFRTSQDPTLPLVQGLMIGSKALGLDRSGRGIDHATAIAALFMPAPPKVPSVKAASSTPDGDGWQDFMSKLAALRDEHPGTGSICWKDHLLNIVGARQGGGSTVYAVDVSRLKTAIEITAKNLALDITIAQGGLLENEKFRAQYNELRGASKAIEKEAEKYRAWRFEMKEWTGDQFDKDQVVQGLRNVVEHARNAGLAVGLEQSALLKTIEDFRVSPFKAALDDIARMIDPSSRSVVLTVLGADHRSVIDLSTDLRRRFDVFLAGVQNTLKGKMVFLGEDPRGAAVDALTDEVSQLVVIVKELASL